MHQNLFKLILNEILARWSQMWYMMFQHRANVKHNGQYKQ